MCIYMVYKIITRINPPCTCQKSIKLHDYTWQCLLLFQTESCSNKTCDIGWGTNYIHLLYWPFEKCMLWYLHMCTYMLGKGHLPWNYFYLWWPHAFHSHVCRSCASIKSIKDHVLVVFSIQCGTSQRTMHFLNCDTFLSIHYYAILTNP